ncbi:hypothetical protein BKA93DRAFT_818642 [Sparassis latifolia]|uniref:Cupredoxin n=1 Tax=Sparassis crispa TaxID=139825 RepID=A0A401G7Z5_9APHY|nr:hypothetical protein SCP_0111800 [Sparassis crispa]GBE78296.1 hypothetical protein SCP_0111800 [Sparassis crispa]
MLFPIAVLSLGVVFASSAAAQQVFDVTVGSSNGSLIYTPSSLSAAAGDQVVFHFEQKNHTASQSTFEDPCHLVDGGFDSGFMPVPSNQTNDFPTFTVTVNDTNPVWVYCRQAANTPQSHCGNGMVFAVNPGPDGSSNSFANYLQNALNQGAALKSSVSSSAASTVSAAWTTAAYGGVTIPAQPTPIVVTETITVQGSSWVSVYPSYIGSPEPTPVSLQGAVHTVVVGGANGELTYTPSNITAQPRDTVVFEFHQKNHTATQSSFPDPCRILTNATTDQVIGLDSGFRPVAANATEFPTWNFTVNDTAPTWFYCKQHTPTGASHCGSGMVFAVNAVADSPRNFSAFQELAMELNGTNANSSSGSGSGSGSASGSSSNSAEASFGAQLAFALGSVLAVAVALL